MNDSTGFDGFAVKSQCFPYTVETSCEKTAVRVTVQILIWEKILNLVEKWLKR